MKTRNKIFIGVGIVALLAVGFYVIFPFYLVGSPLPLYYIENEDVNNHEVVIEIFDSHNKSILKETHKLSPKESVEYPKLFLPKLTEEEYIFKITLDSEVTETYETEIYPWLMVAIHLYHKDPASGEVTPIDIWAAVV